MVSRTMVAKLTNHSKVRMMDFKDILFIHKLLMDVCRESRVDHYCLGTGGTPRDLPCPFRGICCTLEVVMGILTYNAQLRGYGKTAGICQIDEKAIHVMSMVWEKKALTCFLGQGLLAVLVTGVAEAL